MAAELQSQIGSLFQSSGIPGLGIALIEDGNVTWVGSFGVKDVETRDPVTKNTVFHAGSVSKPIAAYLALILCYRDKLGLDDGIGLILGIDDPQMGSITPRQILAHTSGLPNWFPELTRRLEGGSLLPKGCFPSASPGERFLYSGEGYFWLQRAIERIVGHPFNIFAQQELFAGLEMRNSSFVWRSEFTESAASGHDEGDRREDRVRRMRIHALPNAASLYTTAQDLGRFVCSLINPSVDDQKICDLMLTPQVQLNDQISWSLGWGMESEAVQDGPWFWHHGRGKFTNLVIWSRKRKNGVVILTNTERSETAESLERKIVEVVTGIEHPAFDFMPIRTMQKMGFLV